MAGETDPAAALGHAFSYTPALEQHHIDTVLNVSGLNGNHTAHTQPVHIRVLGHRESKPSTLTIEERAARKIASIHPAGTPQGDFFRKNNSHLL